MQAQITLGILLVIEIIASVFGYCNGTGLLGNLEGKTVIGTLLSLTPVFVIFVFFPVTLLLFLATSCGLNEQGELKRDTFAFKMAEWLYPEIVHQEEIRLYPTFCNMAWGMMLTCIALVIIGGIFWLGWVKFTNAEFRSLVYSALMPIAFVTCYIAIAAMALNETLGNLIAPHINKKDRISFNLDLGIVIFMLVWFVASALSQGDEAKQYCDLKLINPRNFYYYYLHNVGAVALETLYVMIVIWVGYYTVRFGGLVYDLIKGSAIPNTISAWYHKACPIIKIEKKEENNL